MKNNGIMIDSQIRKLTLLIYFLLVCFITSSCNKNIDDSNVESTRLSPIRAPNVSTILVDEGTFSPTITSSPEPTFTTETKLNPTDDYKESYANKPVNIIPSGTFQICSPLASEEIDQLWEIVSDLYNPPAANREERHHGVDFSYYRRNDRVGIEGEIVQSILPGIVAAVVFDRLPYGNMVMVETRVELLPDLLRERLNLDKGNSLYVLYAHLKEPPSVELGQVVACGQEIGLVGSTGYNVVNPHLHVETRIGVRRVTFDSMVFYDTSALPDEMENYRRWRTSGDFVHFDPMFLFQFYMDYREHE